MASETTIKALELKRYLLRQTRRMRRLYKYLLVTIVVVFLALCSHVIYYYNYLTDLKYDVLTWEGKVAGAIQYRRNILPMLADSVASFVGHEDNVFNRTVDARERGLGGSAQLSAALRRAIKGASGKGPAEMRKFFRRIMAIAEQYPQLKTSDVYQLLMTQLTTAEQKIFDQRLRYNDAVNVYTTALSMFPGNVYALLFGFPAYEYFKGLDRSEWPGIGLTATGRATGGHK